MPCSHYSQPLVTSLGRAWLAVLVCLGIGVTANLLAAASFADDYQSQQISNFLFFWFPNQPSVFALGRILYFTLRDCPRLMERIGRHSLVLGLAAMALFCLLAYLPPLGHYLGGTPWVPAAQVACLPMVVLVLAMSRNSGWLVNRTVEAIGRVSFSVYLLHFAVLHVFTLLPGMFMTRSAGVTAIAAYGMAYVVCATVTFALSAVSFRFIEQPGVALGKRLIARLRPGRSAVASVG
jgi:peptidoglycan/LPS O-acetylase OafA/YrhL